MADPFDPDYETKLRALRNALHDMGLTVTKVLNDAPLMNVYDLPATDLPTIHAAALTEKQWRLIRFAIWHAERTVT